MTNTGTSARTSDEITAQISLLGQALQGARLNAAARAVIDDHIAALGAELVKAIDQEEATAAEIGAWGRPEQYV